jgi:glycosyltransferase involved in cell wall biosynthesis
MSEPLVSVIIPAYNQAEFLGDAIRSVLEQTYANIEAIVVDDLSPDNTAEVVQSFRDPRLRYIVHDRNRMLAAARNTGMRAARGDIFALLDADDYFDRSKLAMHVEFLRCNPEIGVSYNNRWDLQCSDKTIRNFWRAPAAVGLGDLVLGFPFAPSDMLLRREWAYAVDMFDESYVHFSEDLDINCRLALAGCKFAGVDRCLNFRRYHSGRVIRNASKRLDAAMRSLDTTFADPRTPSAVHVLKNRAYSDHYVVWAVEALRQNDTPNGLRWLREAARWRPAVLEGDPNDVTAFLLYDAIYDETVDHRQVYRNYVEQLVSESASEFAAVVRQAEWGIARGWLVKAYRALIWGERSAGRDCVREAARMGAECDESLVREVVYQLLGQEREVGRSAAEASARCLDDEFRILSGGVKPPSFGAAMQIAKAYEYYSAGRYLEVSTQILRAVRLNPHRTIGRGLLSMFIRSTAHAWKDRLQRRSTHPLGG